MASRTKIPPRTSPVKIWAASAEAEMSIIYPWCAPVERGLCPRNPVRGGGLGRGAEPPSESLGVALFGAGAVQLLVGRDAADDVVVAPLAAHLALGHPLDD